jgi:hypothetical protein
MKNTHKTNLTLGLHKISIIFLILIVFVKFSYSQTVIVVNITQPPKLVAHAGNDTTITLGNHVVLGSMPAATGGMPNYTYLWTPSTGLTSNTIANPTATPTDTTLYTLLITDANGCTDSSSIKVNVSSTVSLINLSNNNWIKIFPNPSHGTFEIQLSNINTSFNLTITNNSGQIVYSKEYEKGSLKNKNTIDLSGYAKADYYLNIKNTDIDITRKIILN